MMNMKTSKRVKRLFQMLAVCGWATCMIGLIAEQGQMPGKGLIIGGAVAMATGLFLGGRD